MDRLLLIHRIRVVDDGKGKRWAAQRTLMKTIETMALIGADRKLTVQLPADILPGEHRVVVVIDKAEVGSLKSGPLNLPVHDVGPWPEGLSLRREGL